MRRTALITAVFVICLAGAFALSEYLARQYYPQPVQPVRLGAAFSLTAHDGSAVTEQLLGSRPSALFFGFTHCPEVCPTTLNDLSVLREQIQQAGGDFQIVFVTLDPLRDTQDVLAQYIPYFGSGITGITGPEGEIHALARAWGVFWQKNNITPEGYNIDHTATVFLLDETGSFKGTIDFHESRDIALMKLKRLTKLAL